MVYEQKYIDSVDAWSRYRYSLRIPLPNNDCAKEVILMMIKRTKGTIKIFVKDFDKSIYTDKDILTKLSSRSYRVFEGDLVKDIPGYFATFGEDSFVYQKSDENGFKGTSNFHNREIVKGMEAAWEILNNED